MVLEEFHQLLCGARIDGYAVVYYLEALEQGAQ